MINHTLIYEFSESLETHSPIIKQLSRPEKYQNYDKDISRLCRNPEIKKDDIKPICERPHKKSQCHYFNHSNHKQRAAANSYRKLENLVP